MHGCDAFADIHDHNGRSFLEDFAEQALGAIPEFLTDEDEEENVISRSSDACSLTMHELHLIYFRDVNIIKDKDSLSRSFGLAFCLFKCRRRLY